MTAATTAEELARKWIGDNFRDGTPDDYGLSAVLARSLIKDLAKLLTTFSERVRGEPQWRPIETAPDFVRKQAGFFPPRLGELIYKTHNDGDGSVWVVMYDNPSSKPKYALKLSPPTTETTRTDNG